MSLWLQIASGSSLPIYTQIVEQVSEAIARGDLAPGEKLPPVRALAKELVVNPNTVAKAYSLLERSGLVRTKTGAGTFVSDPRFRCGDPADLGILTERLDMVLARGLNLGLSTDQLTELFNERLAKFTGSAGSKRERPHE